MNSRNLSAVRIVTSPPARSRSTSSLLLTARLPKYVADIPVSARKDSMS